MVNGVVIISTTFFAVLVIFIYLCEFMDSRSGCDCVLNQQVRSADYLGMQSVTACNDTCIRGD